MSRRSERQLSLFATSVAEAPASTAIRDETLRLARPSDEAVRQFAVDPRHDVVLEASAGTGKTSVLVQRYLNLLRCEVEPANILAITFTRKAAAEMRVRIVTELQKAAARGEIRPVTWRALRDRLSDIAISTIDAFCLSLLHEFPLEADLDPGFGLADEIEAPALVDEALDRAMRTIVRLSRTDEATGLLLAQLGPSRLRTGLAHLIERRLVAPAAFNRYLATERVPASAAEACGRFLQRLESVFATNPGGVAAFLRSGAVGDPRFGVLARDLRRVGLSGDGTSSPRPEDGTSTSKPAGVRLLAERLERHFLRQDGQPRTRLPKYPREAYASDAHRAEHARITAALAPGVFDALQAFWRELNLLLARAARRAFSVAVTEHRRTLDRQGILDFPEALARTLHLLTKMDEFARSRFRLESRYHHVLVDELQDTSRAQWQLVSLLVQSWGEGAGLVQEGPLPPSIFVVGDRKQSIYRFRDADATILEAAAHRIETLRPRGSPRRSIVHSFRAAPELLLFVNDLFSAVAAEGGGFRYDDRDRFPVPESHRTARAETAVALVPARDAQACAVAVADEIARLLTAGIVRDRASGVRRPVQRDDIAVLFRARESHREFQRALRARGIPSYVHKGLGFFEADEVRDVMALIRWAAEPDSDLHAAALLRSRVVRLSDDALRQLAPDVASALTSPSAPEVAAAWGEEDRQTLEGARRLAASGLQLLERLPPAEWLDWMLDACAYHAELRGPDRAQAWENLKKVRGLVRRLQNRGFATMNRVGDQLRQLSVGEEANAVVDAADAVHLMTIHAAKGLEFPIVFLVELTRGAGGGGDPIRVYVDEEAETASISIGGFRSAADELERTLDRDESKRLLYVAVTRARDRLYLSGAVGDSRQRPPAGSLAEVMPPSLLALLPEALASAEPAVVWTGSTTAHVMRVVRTSDGDDSRVDHGDDHETQRDLSRGSR